jgi:hypothetical protein
MWVFLKFFVEEHDIGIDLLTKIHPNPVWHLKDKIKTPVRCELACELAEEEEGLEVGQLANIPVQIQRHQHQA